jgi:hypothetical protein
MLEGDRDRETGRGQLSASMPGMKHFNLVPVQFMTAFKAIKYIPYKFFAIVDKVNKRNLTQLRVLIVTDTHLYSATPLEGSIQRCIELRLIKEVRYCTARLQIGLVVPEEHDFLFSVSESQAFEEFKKILPKRIMWCEEAQTLAAVLALEKPADFVRKGVEAVRWCVSASTVIAEDDPSLSSAAKRGGGMKRAKIPPSETTSATEEVSSSAAAEDIADPLGRSLNLDDDISEDQLGGVRGSRRRSSHVSVDVRSVGTNTEMLGAEFIADGSVRSTGGGDMSFDASFSPGDAQRTLGNVNHVLSSQVVGAASPSLLSTSFAAPTAVAGDGDKSKMLSRDSAEVLYRHELERLRSQMLAEQLRSRELQQSLTELLQSFQACVKTLQRNEDELRGEVERLSVENMILKRPTPEI